MEKQAFRLAHSVARARAVQAVRSAPDGFVVEIREPKRSLDASAKFHAICGDVARQAKFMGKALTPLQWKVLFVSGHAVATGLPAEIVPGLEGEFVNIRESTAQMGAKRMASLLEYVQAWCAENEIQLRDVVAQGYEQFANFR